MGAGRVSIGRNKILKKQQPLSLSSKETFKQNDRYFVYKNLFIVHVNRNEVSLYKAVN